MPRLMAVASMPIGHPIIRPHGRGLPFSMADRRQRLIRQHNRLAKKMIADYFNIIYLTTSGNFRDQALIAP
jgi:hypothetical protein